MSTGHVYCRACAITTNVQNVRRVRVNLERTFDVCRNLGYSPVSRYVTVVHMNLLVGSTGSQYFQVHFFALGAQYFEHIFKTHQIFL